MVLGKQKCRNQQGHPQFFSCWESKKVETSKDSTILNALGSDPAPTKKIGKKTRKKAKQTHNKIPFRVNRKIVSERPWRFRRDLRWARRCKKHKNSKGIPTFYGAGKAKMSKLARTSQLFLVSGKQKCRNQQGHHNILSRWDSQNVETSKVSTIFNALGSDPAPTKKITNQYREKNKANAQ